jgi:hypothetical protein
MSKKKKLRKKRIDPLIFVSQKTIKTATPQKCGACGKKGNEFRYEFLHYVQKWKLTCPECIAKIWEAK